MDVYEAGNEWTLEIREELRKLIPPMAADERSQLEANIKADGCREPLVVWKDGESYVVIDGHNRYDICTAGDIEYQVTIVSGVESEDDARNWMIDNQLGRRNITAAQRINLLMHKRVKVAEDAKGRKAQARGQSRGSKSSVPLKRGEETQSRKSRETNAVIGREAGVSTSTVDRAVKVLEGNDEKLKAEMLEGKKSIAAAARQVRNKSRTTIKPKKPRPDVRPRTDFTRRWRVVISENVDECVGTLMSQLGEDIAMMVAGRIREYVLEDRDRDGSDPIAVAQPDRLDPEASKPVIGLTKDFKPRRNMDIFHDQAKAADDLASVFGADWCRGLLEELAKRLDASDA